MRMKKRRCNGKKSEEGRREKGRERGVGEKKGEGLKRKTRR